MSNLVKEKKLAKEEKARLKAEAAEKKEREFQQKIVTQFNEKQEKAQKATTNVSKLREWLQNPPYKCTDAKL